MPLGPPYGLLLSRCGGEWIQILYPLHMEMAVYGGSLITRFVRAEIGRAKRGKLLPSIAITWKGSRRNQHRLPGRRPTPGENVAMKKENV